MANDAESANRLLIMEDDPGLAGILTEVAQDMGFEVSSVATVEECRRAYEDCSPTALVLDVILPGEGAAELIPFLAARNCTAPIVFVSGFDSEVLFTVDRMSQARGLHVAGVYTKPLLLEQMTSLLQDLIQREVKHP